MIHTEVAKSNVMEFTTSNWPTTLPQAKPPTQSSHDNLFLAVLSFLLSQRRPLL